MVSDLVTLSKHIPNGLRRLERTIDGEAAPDGPGEFQHPASFSTTHPFATMMEKLGAALNNMSHRLSMFAPDNRLLLWNNRYVKMYRPVGAPARRVHAG